MIMTDNNENKVLNVPHLRFPEFTDEWKESVLSDFVERVKRKNKNNLCKLPLTISAQYGLVDQISFFNKVIASENMSNYYLLHKGDFAYNKSYSSEYPWGAIKRLDCYEQGTLSSLYICFKPYSHVSSDFLTHYFETSKWHQGISEIAVEGARNHGLLNVGIQDFFETRHCLPQSLLEQEKIAKFLNLIEERIATQNKIIEDLKKLKSAIRKKMFSLLKDEYTESFEINQLLDYEQPTAYIVANDEYSTDTSLTPVLTANKGFILGYTDEKFGIYQKGECIIFDDFTMDAKYVSFPFKVKSSAIKILTAKPNVNLRFMFEYLSYWELKSEGHKRHYISEIASLVIELPSKERQSIIASLMTSLNSKLDIEAKTKIRYEEQKRYLLSQMFI